MAALSLQPFDDAIAQLVQAIAFAKKHQALGEQDYYKQFRAATIQAFEYSYDISQKLIRRYIETAAPSAETNRHLDFRDYMRVAAEYGLLAEPGQWTEFRQWRNETSHTYNAQIAETLFVQLPEIATSMAYTCEQLRKHSAS